MFFKCNEEERICIVLAINYLCRNFVQISIEKLYELAIKMSNVIIKTERELKEDFWDINREKVKVYRNIQIIKK